MASPHQRWTDLEFGFAGHRHGELFDTLTENFQKKLAEDIKTIEKTLKIRGDFFVEGGYIQGNAEDYSIQVHYPPMYGEEPLRKYTWFINHTSMGWEPEWRW